MPDGKPRTLLSFDFGLKRIGIAVGDTVTRTAAPRPAASGWADIEREIRSLAPQELIVGAPGEASSVAKAAEEFAQDLARRFKLPVHRMDERFSSIEASAALKAGRASGTRKRRVHKEDVDSAAAAVILERWLAAHG